MFDKLIRFSAQIAPRAMAASGVNGHVSFERMDQDVDRLAHALDVQGIKPGHLTGVCIRDGYLHLLMILACARLRAPTVSLIPHMAAGMVALTSPRAVIVDDPSWDVGGARRIAAQPDWVAGVLATPKPEPWTARRSDPHALARVQLSSGTTGEPKAVGLSWALMDSRIGHTNLANEGLKRMISLIGPESGALQTFVACWSQQGCVLFGPDTVAGLVDALPALAPQALLCSPVQLEAILGVMPRDALPMSNLRINIAGGRASRALTDQARLRLGSSVDVCYASTEAGVSTLGMAGRLPNDACVGWTTPFTQIEAVDEADRPVAAGEQGRLRIRSTDLVDGYLNDAALTAARFKDGWFYPGDLGAVAADGMVSVHGREDEVMNFGGQKFLPETLEAPVRGVAGVVDVAAFAMTDPSGVSRPWLAIVRGGGLEEQAIAAALTLPDLPAVHIVWIDVIPRTVLGKVRREALQQAARPLQVELAQKAAS